MNLPVEVIDAVRERRCVVFVGSRYAAEARQQAGLASHTGAEVAKSLGWRRPRPMPGRHPRPTTPSIQMAAAAREKEVGRDAMMSELEALVGTATLSPTDAHRITANLFERIFTTSCDSLMNEAVATTGHTVVGPKEPLIDGPMLVNLRGTFATAPIVTSDDWVPFDEAQNAAMRRLIRSNVVLFVGYRPDEEEFELVFEQLTAAYRAELPRCHLAVAQGRIEDYQWQRWVWRGLLLFTADPSECMNALEAKLK